MLAMNANNKTATEIRDAMRVILPNIMDRSSFTGISDLDLWLAHHMLLLPSIQRICHQNRASEIERFRPCVQSDKQEKTQDVCRCESEDWEGNQSAVGKV